MSTILPEGEQLRRAIQWIAEQRSRHPEVRVSAFVHQAITRFDLQPLDAEFLIGFYKKDPAPDNP
ncbi:MAG: hypothetical protein A2284_05210 [Deltaproteobacteria bacterium RIFOXYA12_FULL_61_11]|nr:MAG: hypothetical protein A2284_05210 [Deltaproteobacteria bacterium RIFOXYA12_FULL_61_11]